MKSVCNSSLLSMLPFSCAQAGSPERARAMHAEKTFLRPSSALAWREYALVLENLGEHVAARAANEQAENLGFKQGGFGAH